MKRNDLLQSVMDMLLAFLLALSGAGCMATAFSFKVSMPLVALTALVFAVLSTGLMRLKKGWLFLVLTVLCSLLLRRLSLFQNVLSALNRILSLYHRGYGWGVPAFLSEYNKTYLTLSMQALAALCACFTAIALRKKVTVAAALAAIGPLLPCMVLTDTVPDSAYLLMGIFAVALLALTAHARRRDARQQNRLTALLLIPLLLFCLLLGLLCPRQGYTPPDDAGIFALMEQLAQHIPFLRDPVQGPTSPPSNGYSVTVDLSQVGPRETEYAQVMRVVASQSGWMYLRGRSYIGYSGIQWQVIPKSEGISPPYHGYLQASTQTLQITWLTAQQVSHYPYYLNSRETLVNGSLSAPLRDSTQYRYKPLQASWQQLWLIDNSDVGTDNSSYASLTDYLQLPERTAEALQRHLQLSGALDAASIPEMARAIGDYVQTSATYDTETGRPPETEGDFALWFLENSDTGYCIHFATAATVLLRAAGIPARYVEGYLLNLTAGQETTVLAEQAHAWTEYYVPNLGWVVLEATPEGGLPEPPATYPTQPPTTAPTEPPTTEATQPVTTAPTEPTEPPITAPVTRPTQPVTTAPVEQPKDNSPVLQWLVPLLWVAVCPAAVLVLLYLQWKWRILWRRKRMAGREYIHVLRRWRYSRFLARLCGRKPPKALYDLLKKAKFSQHQLDDRELRQFARYQSACIRRLKQRPRPLRLLLRLILAAW